jgi:hypothetical protein
LDTPSTSSTSRPLGRSARTERAARGASSSFELLDLDLLDLLEAALRLLRLGRLGAEALDEGALVGDDLLRPRDLGLLALPCGGLLDDEGRVVARVLRDRAVVDVEDVGGDVVEEALVVGDDERAPGSHEELLEPADRQDVEVVGRLVEEERVGARRRAPARAGRGA